jgi:glycosyltransferase involved in cell wall biosynthesis
MNEIILSICIPTYNRAEYLENTIRSIVSQERFILTSDVEIVISDNCSNDQTAEVSNRFAKEFPNKIFYYKNETNVIDENFELSLRRGRGLFLKLNNDTLLHEDNSLNRIISTIEQNKEHKDLLFFSNNEINSDSAVCESLDAFVRKVSYNINWIGAFGIWRDDLLQIKDFSRYAYLLLTQTDVLIRLIGQGRKIFVDNEKIFSVAELKKKGGYDLITVFLENYSLILKEAVSTGKMNSKTYGIELNKTCLNFLAPWIARINAYPEIYYFQINNWQNRISVFLISNRRLWLQFYLKYKYCLFILQGKKLLKQYIRR